MTTNSGQGDPADQSSGQVPPPAQTDAAGSESGNPTPAPGSGGSQPGSAQPTPPTSTGSGADSQSGRFVPLDRFNGVVAQKYEAIRNAEQATQRAAELERQVRELQAKVSGTGDGQAVGAAGMSAPPLTQAEIDRLATVRAEQLRFNERCNESVMLGRKAHTDFDAAVADLRKVSTLMDANGQPLLPQALIEAALETGQAHEVLYALGKDTAEADRIMSLAANPVRQAVEVARFAAKLKPAQAASGAEGDEGVDSSLPAVVVVRGAGEPPPPIRPVVGASRGLNVKDMPLDDPNLPMEEFVRRRNEDDKRRRSNGRWR